MNKDNIKKFEALAQAAFDRMNKVYTIDYNPRINKCLKNFDYTESLKLIRRIENSKSKRVLFVADSKLVKKLRTRIRNKQRSACEY